MYSWWEGNLVQPCWRTVWKFLKTIKKIELPYDPAIPLLGIHPKKMESLCQSEFFTPLVTASLVTTVEMWKQSKRLVNG